MFVLRCPSWRMRAAMCLWVIGLRRQAQRLKLTEAKLRTVLNALLITGTDNALGAKVLMLVSTRIGELTKAECANVFLLVVA